MLISFDLLDPSRPAPGGTDEQPGSVNRVEDRDAQVGAWRGGAGVVDVDGEELAGADVGDLDMLRRRVHVRASIAEVDGKLPRVATKTKRQRTVGLPVFLCEMLAAYLADRPHSPDDLVFPDPTRPGTWLRHANWYVTHFKPAVRKAGLPANLRFHDLRHTCASLLIAQGADPKAVSTRLGHTTVQMTLDRYTHLFANRDDEITAGLDTVYRAAQMPAPAATAGEVVALR